MTDIVERLRDHDRHIRGRLIEGLTDLVIDDMVEAADEIERLREALRKIEYLDSQQVRGLPRRVSIHDIARDAIRRKSDD